MGPENVGLRIAVKMTKGRSLRRFWSKKRIRASFLYFWVIEDVLRVYLAKANYAASHRGRGLQRDQGISSST
jgi:hypothetical protein